jgi:2-oxoisovalerate dehydrogenase E1 component
MARKSGFTKGRDRSFHFGTQQYKIIGMILRSAIRLLTESLWQLKENGKITAVFTGEGATSEGDFMKHLILLRFGNYSFVIENNGYDFRPSQMNTL